MSSLTLRISGFVNWEDLVGVKPQFGLKVSAIISKASCCFPEVPEGPGQALFGQALVSAHVSCARAGSPLDPVHIWQAVAQWNTRDWEHG